MGTSTFPAARRWSLNMPILAVVPPRSMPNAYSFIVHLPLLRPGTAFFIHTSQYSTPAPKSSAAADFHANRRKTQRIFGTNASAHRTVLVRLPMPSISQRTVSPGFRNCGGSMPMPTPAGVPVAMMVPAFRVMP